MEKHDITNVNYITEKDNMLIFARLGVMKNNQDNVFIYHFPLIVVQINFFSSKNTEKFRRDASHPHTNDERKDFLTLKHL